MSLSQELMDSGFGNMSETARGTGLVSHATERPFDATSAFRDGLARRPRVKPPFLALVKNVCICVECAYLNDRNKNLNGFLNVAMGNPKNAQADRFEGRKTDPGDDVRRAEGGEEGARKVSVGAASEGA